jgi:hypothetical protein
VEIEQLICITMMGLLRRLRVKHYILLGIVGIVLAEYFGVFRHLKEKNFDTEFVYPLAGDVSRYVAQLKAGQTPSATPVFKHEYYMYKHPKAGVYSISVRKTYPPSKIEIFPFP